MGGGVNRLPSNFCSWTVSASPTTLCNVRIFWDAQIFGSNCEIISLHLKWRHHSYTTLVRCMKMPGGTPPAGFPLTGSHNLQLPSSLPPPQGGSPQTKNNTLPLHADGIFVSFFSLICSLKVPRNAKFGTSASFGGGRNIVSALHTSLWEKDFALASRITGEAY